MNINKKFLLIIFSLVANLAFASENLQIKYRIEGISGDIKDNLEILLNDLPKTKDATELNYLKQIKETSNNAMNSFGYYQPKVELSLVDLANNQTILVKITPERKTLISEIEIKIIGDASTDPEFIKLHNEFPLKKGDPLQHNEYENAKKKLESLATKKGYFDAKYIKARVEVLSKKASANVYLYFDSGPRYQFGELVFLKEFPVKRFVKSLQSFKAGDPFDSNLLAKFTLDLSNMGYFSNLLILPDLENKKGMTIPLIVIAAVKPKDSYNIGLGFASDEGIHGRVGWNRPLVNTRGDSIESDFKLSKPKQEISLVYKVPIEDPIYNYYSFQTGYKHTKLNDTNSDEYLLRINHNLKLQNDWLQTFFLKFQGESGTQGDQKLSTNLIIPGVTYNLQKSKGGINSIWGEQHLFSFEASSKLWLSNRNLFKVFNKNKWLRSYKKNLFILETKLGAILTGSIDEVPSSMRFFTGGDQSIRGYGYQKISPKDKSGYLTGGQYLAVLNIEYRYKFMQDWSLALFTDFGTATNDFSEKISSSTGIGVVWGSPIGPIRFYLAKPFSNDSDSIRFHFMIGSEI